MAELLKEIIDRAKTFTIYNWRYRSVYVFDPYMLASQGYECVDLDILQCHVCHHKVLFANDKGEQREQSQVHKQLQGHDNTCSYYQQNGTKITREQLYLRMDDLIKNVKESYLKYPSKDLPYINFQNTKNKIAQNDQTQIFQTILNKCKLNLKQMKTSFILTLLGWARKDAYDMKCQFCGRLLENRLFRINYEDKQNLTEYAIDQKFLFDPLKEHRYFCLWVHQQNGWEIYIQHLFDKLGQSEELFKGKDPQSLKKIRVLIDSYLQNFQNTTDQNFDKIKTVLDECQELGYAIQEGSLNRDQFMKQSLQRRKKMQKFVQEIEEEVRKPLKMIKID